MTRARETLVHILDLSYKVGHSSPDDVEAKLAIRCIGFDAVYDPNPSPQKLRQAFESIASRAEEIVDRAPPFHADVVATDILATYLNWRDGHPAPRKNI